MAINFELHSVPGALGTKIWKEDGNMLPAQASMLQSEGAIYDEEWQAWWLPGDASRDSSGVKTRMERAEELVARLVSAK